MTSQINPPSPAPPKSGSGCGKGCGAGCVVALLIAAACGYMAYRYIASQYNRLVGRYDKLGYERVYGQVIEVKERVTEPTIYIAQLVTVHAGSDRGMAFMCQQADLHGDVVGNVHFIGQALTVHPDAILHRDLELNAQVVNVYGVVSGKITGVYQTLNRTPPDE